MIYTDEKEFPYKLNEQVNQDIFETEIVSNLFNDASKDNKELEVFFIGGQPASGKTDTLTSIKNDLKKRNIFLTAIDADSLRSYHPDYQKLNNIDDKSAAVHTGADIGRWTEKAISYAIENRINVVIEGTFREPKTVKKSIELFKDAGYKINVQAISVKSEASEISTHKRYEAQKKSRGFGRYVPKEAHDAAYEGVPRSLRFVEENNLSDTVGVRTRGADILYFNERIDNKWISPISSHIILTQERNREWSPNELELHFKLIEEVQTMIKERNGSPEELAYIEALKVRHEESLKGKDVRDFKIEYEQGLSFDDVTNSLPLLTVDNKVENDGFITELKVLNKNNDLVSKIFYDEKSQHYVFDPKYNHEVGYLVGDKLIAEYKENKMDDLLKKIEKDLLSSDIDPNKIYNKVDYFFHLEKSDFVKVTAANADEAHDIFKDRGYDKFEKIFTKDDVYEKFSDVTIKKEEETNYIEANSPDNENVRRNK